MKKILTLAIILCATLAKAQWDFTYSTNLFYALTYPTNVYIGTNGTDTNVDTFHFWATKINAAHTLFWTHLQTDEATITNQGLQIGTNSGAISNLQTNVWTVSQISTGLTITNGTNRAFWFIQLQMSNSLTAWSAVTISRPGIRTNTFAPDAKIASAVSTNLFFLPVNASTTNSMTDASGSGASVNVLDSHLEQ